MESEKLRENLNQNGLEKIRLESGLKKIGVYRSDIKRLEEIKLYSVGLG